MRAQIRVSKDATMTTSPADIQSADQHKVLRYAEATLLRIQRYAQDAEDDRITPGEAIEQILDELAARPTLGRMRRALGRSFAPARAH